MTPGYQQKGKAERGIALPKWIGPGATTRLISLSMAPPVEKPAPAERFFSLLQEALHDGSLIRITLGDYVGAEAGLKKIIARPIVLKQGPRLSFVFRHLTRDVTKNLLHQEGLRRLQAGWATDFHTAHLWTTRHTAQLEYRAGREPKLTLSAPRQAHAVSLQHDRPKRHALSPEDTPWLRDLGIATADGKVAKGMEGKYRQIQKFVELLEHLFTDAKLMGETRRSTSSPPSGPPLTLVDMAAGKGYLTFAAYEWMRRALPFPTRVLGVETRVELVDLCRGVARKNHLEGLDFQVGTIADTALTQVDVLIALHACDTATDDAIARGIQAGASLIVVAPCCHKELRPRLRPPPALKDALRHGILLEREAEFVTDALRAALLEWAGYDTRVFEFISTEHTSKNLMIAGCKRSGPAGRGERVRQVRDLAAFYGVTQQRLAQELGFELGPALGSDTRTTAPQAGR